MIGKTLGPYQVVAKLGEGGMGEVYQARDTRLGRDVAIKVSAAEFSERFEREARAIAALNHPNICTLYDVGPNYLVMELVSGPTLAEVIAAARTPGAEGVRLADAIAIARQIAEALEAAHEKGIVHRDLKPANVKITPDGAVKVLDFGLAKALAPDEASATADANSPTLLSPARTERGVILGTAAYMAPEQAKGRPVDKRADIWAFGVVLFEMLTGRKLFRGETATEIIAAVIKDDIALDRLPPAVPPAIRRLLARCLERDPRQRLRDIGEARIALADPASTAASAIGERPETPGRSRASMMIWAALALVLAGAAAAAAWWLKPGADLTLRRIDLADPLASADGLALSPDGSRIAYFSGAHLYVRALDALAPQDLGAVHVTSALPFWSPDGRTIGFFCSRRDQHDPGGRRTGAAGLQNPGDRVRARLRVAAGRDDFFYGLARQPLHRARGGRHAGGLSGDRPEDGNRVHQRLPAPRQPPHRHDTHPRAFVVPNRAGRLGIRSQAHDDRRGPRRDVRQIRSARRAAVQATGTEQRHLGRAV